MAIAVPHYQFYCHTQLLLVCWVAINLSRLWCSSNCLHTTAILCFQFQSLARISVVAIYMQSAEIEADWLSEIEAVRPDQCQQWEVLYISSKIPIHWRSFLPLHQEVPSSNSYGHTMPKDTQRDRQIELKEYIYIYNMM